MTELERTIIALEICSLGKTCVSCPLTDECHGLSNAAMARAAKLLKAREWISVKDRLPEKDEDVIIYGKYIGSSGTAYPEMLITDIDDFDRSGCVPIAWMPLPEPPKEE